MIGTPFTTKYAITCLDLSFKVLQQQTKTIFLMPPALFDLLQNRESVNKLQNQSLEINPNYYISIQHQFIIDLKERTLHNKIIISFISYMVIEIKNATPTIDITSLYEKKLILMKNLTYTGMYKILHKLFELFFRHKLITQSFIKMT